ncbi:hypothetical protein CKN86_01300 [Carnobacterium divergens]|uniref:HAD-IIB family hydrolase n=1 Tax=Carnobacterium divergens TaxID=2748 RepID=UPI000D4BBF78|nr:HAD family hydrolase [Carnobacterium divergens]MCO6018458.1 Cof-type HAD-IIB family hydrolase [Carnobacterium divergens]TFI65218.1 hypothetical protein CKN62_01300 [Carnobacterium divergens]TFI92108.1 hypothetical protein CKN84_01300 [Carnobacterium divergens]TFJ07331.1 hypothetical protein CKN86_01300 [Carnobacterium divergens]TFJ08562.1 hypothetical protein CKN65_01300 [Carnobacterium divergens]
MKVKGIEAVKYAFFDVDGTLMNEEYQIPIELLTNVSRLKKVGILPIICTGREFLSMKKIWEEYLLSDYFYHKVITNDGNCIYDTKTDTFSIMEIIDLSKIKLILKEYESVCRWVITSPQKILYSNKYALMEYKMLFMYSGKSEICTEFDKIAGNINKEELLGFYMFISEQDADNRKFESYGLKKMNYSRGYSYTSNQTKLDGARYLLKKDFEEEFFLHSMAFGNGKNDYLLFKETSYSVAVQNAHPKLIEIATECLHEQSLSQYVRKIFNSLEMK